MSFKKSLLLCGLLYCGIVVADPSVLVTAKQRYPWNGLVDIDCVVSGFEEGEEKTVCLNRVEGDVLKPLRMVTLNGKSVIRWGTRIGNGTHRFVWNASEDLGGGKVLKNMCIDVSFEEGFYYVFDLSGGVYAERYPVSILQNVPEGGWTEEYKTTKLVLRKIPAGSFQMGSPGDEFGRGDWWRYETQHTVILTKDFWIGVFEVTQKQWELVMGTNPSCYPGDTRPMDSADRDDLRREGGINRFCEWPEGNDVGWNSFMGKLRQKTGLMFDLPTEAQWEYACRAGTTTSLNSGWNLQEEYSCAKMDDVGRYSGNADDGKGGYSEHTTVGLYQPNAWGLYDMHGNVAEYVLDGFSEWYGPQYFVDGWNVVPPMTDPKGPFEAYYGTIRGGCWQTWAGECRSASRSEDDRWGGGSVGFRCAIHDASE